MINRFPTPVLSEAELSAWERLIDMPGEPQANLRLVQEFIGYIRQLKQRTEEAEKFASHLESLLGQEAFKKAYPNSKFAKKQVNT